MKAITDRLEFVAIALRPDADAAAREVALLCLSELRAIAEALSERALMPAAIVDAVPRHLARPRRIVSGAP